MGKPQERPAAKMAVAELKKSPGKDHMKFTMRPIENGVRLRLEVESGLLRLARPDDRRAYGRQEPGGGIKP